jgi:REP element-mobilizing transposase RayT
MKQEPYVLDDIRRAIVLESIKQVCDYRNWMLMAVHVRTQHVHALVVADEAPEVIIRTLKAYASRALNNGAIDGPDRHRWARHGSTKYLWTSDQITAAVNYVVSQQGAPMNVWWRTSR